MPKEEIIDFITSCQDSESGGIAASIGHDPHMLYTLSAVQVGMLLWNALINFDRTFICKYRTI